VAKKHTLFSETDYLLVGKPGPRTKADLAKVDALMSRPTISKMSFPPSTDRMDEFITLLVGHQRQLFRYIHSLLPLAQDAEDALQETALVLWRNFDQFSPGTNFFAWACRVAYFQVLAWRKRQPVSVQALNDRVLNLIAKDASLNVAMMDARRAALDNCLKKLRPADRELIERRYAPNARRNDLARAMGRPVNSISKSLGRIRQALWDCVSKSLITGTEDGLSS
jgi:RNA polymerase sigma-70 factor, ECF subfamily